MELNVTVNGKKCCFEIAPNDMLADVLRREGYRGVKIGCREGSCGACTVMFNGKPRNSCLTLAAMAEGAEIMTVEGLGNPDHPHLLQKCYVKHGAAQCGFCNPGSLISAKALLDRNPNPTEDDVKEALDGNLCRCTGYIKRIEAILDAAQEMKKAAKAEKPAAKPAKAVKAAAKPAKAEKPAAKPAKAVKAAAKPAKVAKPAAKPAKAVKAAAKPAKAVKPTKAVKAAKPAKSTRGKK